MEHNNSNTIRQYSTVSSSHTYLQSSPRKGNLVIDPNKRHSCCILRNSPTFSYPSDIKSTILNLYIRKERRSDERQI